MTNEEAINTLNLYGCCDCKNYGELGCHDGSDCWEAKDLAADALRKAEKYRWHDIRKNPNDLPKEGQIIDATDGKYYFSGKVFNRCGGIVIQMILYNKNDYYTSDEEYIANSDIVAWREIDPFEED